MFVFLKLARILRLLFGVGKVAGSWLYSTWIADPSGWGRTLLQCHKKIDVNEVVHHSPIHVSIYNDCMSGSYAARCLSIEDRTKSPSWDGRRFLGANCDGGRKSGGDSESRDCKLSLRRYLDYMRIEWSVLFSAPESFLFCVFCFLPRKLNGSVSRFYSSYTKASWKKLF